MGEKKGSNARTTSMISLTHSAAWMLLRVGVEDEGSNNASREYAFGKRCANVIETSASGVT